MTDYLKSAEVSSYLPALESTAQLVDGFESPLGMELLATVDWLLTKGGREPSVKHLRVGLGEWPGGKSAGRRKLKLFDDRLLTLALERLTERGPPA